MRYRVRKMGDDSRVFQKPNAAGEWVPHVAERVALVLIEFDDHRPDDIVANSWQEARTQVREREYLHIENYGWFAVSECGR